MKSNYYFVIFLLFQLIACGKRERLNAVIYERKKLPENRLAIRYRYKFQEVEFTDSCRILNAIIPSDTIAIFIDPSHPEKSLPDLSETK